MKTKFTEKELTGISYVAEYLTLCNPLFAAVECEKLWKKARKDKTIKMFHSAKQELERLAEIKRYNDWGKYILPERNP